MSSCPCCATRGNALVGWSISVGCISWRVLRPRLGELTNQANTMFYLQRILKGNFWYLHSLTRLLRGLLTLRCPHYGASRAEHGFQVNNALHTVSSNREIFLNNDADWGLGILLLLFTGLLLMLFAWETQNKEKECHVTTIRIHSGMLYSNVAPAGTSPAVRVIH